MGSAESRPIRLVTSMPEWSKKVKKHELKMVQTYLTEAGWTMSEDALKWDHEDAKQKSLEGLDIEEAAKFQQAKENSLVTKNRREQATFTNLGELRNAGALENDEAGLEFERRNDKLLKEMGFRRIQHTLDEWELRNEGGHFGHFTSKQALEHLATSGMLKNAPRKDKALDSPAAENAAASPKRKLKFRNRNVNSNGELDTSPARRKALLAAKWEIDWPTVDYLEKMHSGNQRELECQDCHWFGDQGVYAAEVDGVLPEDFVNYCPKCKSTNVIYDPYPEGTERWIYNHDDIKGARYVDGGVSSDEAILLTNGLRAKKGLKPLTCKRRLAEALEVGRAQDRLELCGVAALFTGMFAGFILLAGRIAKYRNRRRMSREF